jgi:P27 family predicted phage terminase small subunit
MGGPGSGRRSKRGVVDVPAGQPVVVIPRRPVGLGQRGAREWGLVWAAGAAWLNAGQDYPWVEQVARAWDDIAAYRKLIRKEGLVQTGSQGQPVAHPLIAETRKCEDTIRKCLAEIGFSPAARHRLALAQVKTASKIDELAVRREKRAAPAAVVVVVEAEVISDPADGDEW